MVEPGILTAVQSALQKSKELERGFQQTVDLAITLRNVDLSVPKNRIEEEILLPHGRGRDIKVGVFASGDLAARARNVADVVITPELISEYAGDKKRFKKLVNDITFFVSEAPLMPTIGKSLGVVLGPRGKMPRPIPPNIDPTPIVASLRRTIRVRSRDKPTFHTIVGSEAQTAEQVAENVEAVLRRVRARLEQGNFNLRSIFLKTTMGPSVRVSLS